MSGMSCTRQRSAAPDQEPGDPGMWIPGLGENKVRPRELGGGMFGYVPDAFSNNLPELPSESARARMGTDSVGSSSPRTLSESEDRRGRRRPRTAASDSSQMRDAMFHAESPAAPQEVEEEPCVEIDVADSKAVPFFNVGSEKKIIIRGGTVVNHDEMLDNTDIIVEDGVITEMGKDLEVTEDTVVIDAKDKLVVPGGIDFTVHLAKKESGPEKADSIESGSKAALGGGTTTLVELVTPESSVSSMKEAFEAVKSEVEASACCDFAFSVCLPRWDERVKTELEELAKTDGVAVFKLNMCGNLMVERNSEILEAMEAVKSVGGAISVHAENGLVIRENEKRLFARGIRGPEGLLMSRPEEVEEEAVTRAIALAAQVNVPLIISGCTGKVAIQAIERAAARGQAVWAELGVASLANDGSNYFNGCWTHAAGFVTAPPLRDDPSAPDTLLEAAASNSSGCQIVSSHHCSFNSWVKEELGKQNFAAIPHGLNGVEERMSVLWERGVEGAKMDPKRFVALSSTNPAKSLNIYPKKGRIAVEGDADIVIWNKNNLREISAKTQLQKGDFNVFEGLKVHGAPEYVLSGGRIAVYEYEVKAMPGSGKVVAASPFSVELYDMAADFENNKGQQQAVNRSGEGNSEKKPEQVAQVEEEVMVEKVVLNKHLGIYQRPMSAHGVRNQQDSTFSLSGGHAEDRRASIKVNAPPGGIGRRLW